ncbi:MAG TPA: HlyC/CorC family transporter [Candidatus Faecivicinus avistercoris]|nr:HlyC/CorC family transporter [Candidatus Faecivicinus avistercoris]
MDIARQLLLQVILIAINAFFAMTEIAVISLNATKLKKMEEDGDKVATRLLRMVEHSTSFLSTIQIGITLAGYLGSAFAADSFSDGLTSWLYNTVGFQVLSYQALNSVSVVIITVILSYFTLIFGELVPKRIAMQKSMQVAKIASSVITALATVMRPVIWFLTFSTNTVLKLLRLKTTSEEETVTEEEIRMMVDLGEERGTIDSDEGEWIDNVFEFGETTVREAMTHVSELVAIPVDATQDEITKVIRESGRSRIPVYAKNLDDILGILNAREFLLERGEGGDKLPERLIRPAYFVPETLRAATLFKDMQQKKQHIAVVVDEYGQTSGIVTMEDLLEEIVGSIYDETDPAEELPITQIEDGVWRALGSAELDEIADAMDIEFPEDLDFDTLNGLVFSQLNNIPKDGTVLDLQAYGLDIHVERIARRRVVSATLRKLAEEPGEGAAEESKGED